MSYEKWIYGVGMEEAREYVLTELDGTGLRYRCLCRLLRVRTEFMAQIDGMFNVDIPFLNNTVTIREVRFRRSS
jgi:hypothetical protein